MKFSMTGQEKGDLLIEVTAQAGLNVDYFAEYLYTLKKNFFTINITKK